MRRISFLYKTPLNFEMRHINSAHKVTLCALFVSSVDVINFVLFTFIKVEQYKIDSVYSQTQLEFSVIVLFYTYFST